VALDVNVVLDNHVIAAQNANVETNAGVLIVQLQRNQYHEQDDFFELSHEQFTHGITYQKTQISYINCVAIIACGLDQ